MKGTTNGALNKIHSLSKGIQELFDRTGDLEEANNWRDECKPAATKLPPRRPKTEGKSSIRK
jgi:hypothetical protein